MKSQDFVKGKMDYLVCVFPNLKLSYEFDQSDNTHKVNVTPPSYYCTELFAEKTYEIDDEFIEYFPSEGLYFVPMETHYKFKEVIYTVEGADYKDKRYEYIHDIL